jgi:hypothetical protein
MLASQSGSDAAAYGRALLIFLGMAAATAAWHGLNLVRPEIQASGIPQTVSRLIIHGAILGALWAGLSRAGFTGNQHLRIWLAIALPFTAWLGIVWSTALAGGFQARVGPVPAVPMAIFLPVIIGLFVLLRSQRIAAMLDAMPLSWLVGLQLYRVLGGTFLVGWLQGRFPGEFAVPAGSGDVLVGLLALPVAYLLYKGARGATAAAVAWNILGLCDFTSAISLGLMTSPGPLQLLVTAVQNTQLGAYPSVMIPAFAVPSSILLHALSLWQLRRRARRRSTMMSAEAPALA